MNSLAQIEVGDWREKQLGDTFHQREVNSNI